MCAPRACGHQSVAALGARTDFLDAGGGILVDGLASSELQTSWNASRGTAQAAFSNQSACRCGAGSARGRQRGTRRPHPQSHAGTSACVPMCCTSTTASFSSVIGSVAMLSAPSCFQPCCVQPSSVHVQLRQRLSRDSLELSPIGSFDERPRPSFSMPMGSSGSSVGGAVNLRALQFNLDHFPVPSFGRGCIHPAAHGHWCTFTDLHHAMPCHAAPCHVHFGTMFSCSRNAMARCSRRIWSVRLFLGFLGSSAPQMHARLAWPHAVASLR